MNSNFITWFNTFIQEKALPNEIFEIKHNDNIHFIESEFILELIRKTSNEEQTAIKDLLVKIDFKHGNVNHFLKHLAKCYIELNF